LSECGSGLVGRDVSAMGILLAGDAYIQKFSIANSINTAMGITRVGETVKVFALHVNGQLTLPLICIRKLAPQSALGMTPFMQFLLLEFLILSWGSLCPFNFAVLA